MSVFLNPCSDLREAVSSHETCAMRSGIRVTAILSAPLRDQPRGRIFPLRRRVPFGSELDSWSLRGEAVSLMHFAAKISHRCKKAKASTAQSSYQGFSCELAPCENAHRRNPPPAMVAVCRRSHRGRRSAPATIDGRMRFCSLIRSSRRFRYSFQSNIPICSCVAFLIKVRTRSHSLPYDALLINRRCRECKLIAGYRRAVDRLESFLSFF